MKYQVNNIILKVLGILLLAAAVLKGQELLATPVAMVVVFALNTAWWLRLLFFVNLSPEIVVVSSNKSILVSHPVFERKALILL